MRKAKQPILYTLSSLSSFVLDVGIYRLLLALLGGTLGGYTPTVCNVTARVFSSFYNFNINRLVYQHHEAYGKALLRYYLVAVVQLAASTLLLNLFLHLFRVQSDNVSTLVKMLVDGGLFVASYFVQKYWVFSSKQEN